MVVLRVADYSMVGADGMLQATRGMWLVWLAAVLVNMGAVVYMGLNPTPEEPRVIRFVPGLASVIELTIDGQQVERDGRPITLVAGRKYTLQAEIMLHEGVFIPALPNGDNPDLRVLMDRSIVSRARIRGNRFPLFSVVSAELLLDQTLNDLADSQCCVTKTTGERTAIATTKFEAARAYGERVLVFSLDQLAPLVEEVYFEKDGLLLQGVVQQFRSAQVCFTAFDRFPIVVVEPKDGP